MWLDWLVFCDCGYSLSAFWCPLSVPTIVLGFLLPWTWDISSWLQCTAAAPDLGCRVSPLGHSALQRLAITTFHSIQVYVPTSNAEEAEVQQFYEDLKHLLELTPPKRYPFHYKALECKSRKSRNTWSNRQIWPWNTEWSRAKTNRVLPRKCTGHSKHPLPTTQEKTLHMDVMRRPTPKSDWLYSLQPKMEKLYTVNKNKTRADCGSEHELLMAKFRLKFKKVGTTTRTFKYDLNQIPNNYIVETRNRFKGLYLIDRVLESR